MKHLPLIVVALAIVLIGAGCSNNTIKVKENPEEANLETIKIVNVVKQVLGENAVTIQVQENCTKECDTSGNEYYCTSDYLCSAKGKKEAMEQCINYCRQNPSKQTLGLQEAVQMIIDAGGYKYIPATHDVKDTPAKLIRNP